MKRSRDHSESLKVFVCLSQSSLNVCCQNCHRIGQLMKTTFFKDSNAQRRAIIRSDKHFSIHHLKNIERSNTGHPEDGY